MNLRNVSAGKKAGKAAEVGPAALQGLARGGPSCLPAVGNLLVGCHQPLPFHRGWKITHAVVRLTGASYLP